MVIVRRGKGFEIVTLLHRNTYILDKNRQNSSRILRAGHPKKCDTGRRAAHRPLSIICGYLDVYVCWKSTNRNERGSFFSVYWSPRVNQLWKFSLIGLKRNMQFSYDSISPSPFASFLNYIHRWLRDGNSPDYDGFVSKLKVIIFIFFFSTLTTDVSQLPLSPLFIYKR